MNTDTELHGRYFAHGTSKAHEAKLTSSALGDRLYVPDLNLDIAVEIEEIGDRLGNVPRKIKLADQGVFECLDNDGVDNFLARENHFASKLSRAESSYKFVIFAVVATIISIIGIYRYGLPAAASLAANVTPSGVIALIDENTKETVDKVLFSTSNLSEERKQELTTLFDELVEISGQTEPPMKLEFRNGGRLGANAIALPGGTIILTDQLEALVEHDDEIAGVFAHEIGHVEHKHSLKQIYRALGVAFMIAVIGGESDQIVEEVLGAAVLIDSFSYTRDFETESDLHSVEVMLKAGRDPVAFVDLLDRILASHGIEVKEGDEPDTGWLATHPGNKDRRADVEAYVEKLKAAR